MGARFDKSAEQFAMVASRIEPSSLRNQIPRNGGRFLFPYGVDSLMLKTSGNALVNHFRSGSNSVDLTAAIAQSLRESMEAHTRASSSVKWGVGTRNVLESDVSVVEKQLRSNCGITRAMVAGLVSPDTTAEAVCAATHTHTSAIQGAKLVAKSVHVAVTSERLMTEADVSDDMVSYKPIVSRARSLATAKPYDEDEEFHTDLQDRFRGRFGQDASSQCAVASMIFSLYRTIHSLPYLDSTSKSYRERIERLTQPGQEKQNSKLTKNLLGNSNRLDTELLFSKLTPSIEQDLPVALAVGWAISLGGDVRSNACLAGGLAGALWGDEAIPAEWIMFSEGMDEGRALADQLLEISNTLRS